MAGYNIPQVRVDIKPLDQPDYLSLARVMAGVGGGGGGGGGGGRTTKAERQELADQQTKMRAMQVVANDVAIQEKLAKLQSAPVAEQKSTLQDIRRNDIRRIAETTGVDSSTLFNAMLGPMQTQVNERYKAVKDKANIWDSGWLAAQVRWNEVQNAVGNIGASAEERLASAQRVREENEQLIAENPYIQDQRKREAQGEMFTGSGETGSYLANIMGLVPEIAGPLITGGAGGAAGSVVPVVGTGVGAALGIGSYFATTGAQDFASRVEADPRLTSEQKLEAIRTGTPQAALTGGIAGVITAPAGPTGRLALSAAGRLGMSKAAQSLGGRVAGNIGLSALDVGAGTTADVLSRNAIFEQATGLETPLTEGLGQALAAGGPLAAAFGIGRTRLGGRGIAQAEPKAPVQPDATAAVQTPRTAQVDAPVIEGYREVRTPEMMNFDESTRSGYRAGVENKSIDNVQTIYDSYVRDGRTVDDFRKFLDADVASPSPLGPDIVARLRQLLPQEATTRTLSADETSYITSMKQRVLNGEDLTFEQAARDYTGPRADEGVFFDSLTSTLLEGYKTRNDLTAALYGTINKLGRKGGNAEAAVGQFQQAIDKFFTDGGNEFILNRFVEDSAKNKADRDVLSPAPGKLTKAQQSLLREAIQRRQQEQTNVAGTRTVADSNVGRNDGNGAAAADSRNTAGDSGGPTSTGAAAGDTAAGIVRTDSGSNGANESGGLGRAAQSDQRTGQALDVPVEATGAGSGARTDTGRGAESATVVDAAAGEGAGITRGAGVGNEGVAGNAADAGVNSQSNSRAVAEVRRTHSDTERPDGSFGIFNKRTGDLIDAGYTEAEANAYARRWEADRVAEAETPAFPMAVDDLPMAERARLLGTDIETVGRIIEETGELPKVPHPEAQPTPFEATIPEAPRPAADVPASINFEIQSVINTIKGLVSRAAKNGARVSERQIDEIIQLYKNYGGDAEHMRQLIADGVFSPAEVRAIARSVQKDTTLSTAIPLSPERLASIKAAQDFGRILGGGKVPKANARPVQQFQTPHVIRLPDSKTAMRIDAELAAAMKKSPAEAMAHLNKYFEAGGSQYQLDALLKSGKLGTRDKLLLTRAMQSTPEITPTRANTSDVRAALVGLSPDVMSKLAGRFRLAKPQTPATIGAIHQRALSLLVKESLGEKLTPTQKGQLTTLHEAGIPELVLPDNLMQDVSNAKMMGMEVSPEGLVEAKVNLGETIEKITKQILCRAI